MLQLNTSVQNVIFAITVPCRERISVFRLGPALIKMCPLFNPLVNSDDTFLSLLFIFQWFGIFICREWGTSFIMLCETCMGTLIPALSGKPTVARACLILSEALQLIEVFPGAMAGLSGRAEGEPGFGLNVAAATSCSLCSARIAFGLALIL